MPKQYKYSKTFTYDGQRYKVRADTKVDLGVEGPAENGASFNFSLGMRLI